MRTTDMRSSGDDSNASGIGCQRTKDMFMLDIRVRNDAVKGADNKPKKRHTENHQVREKGGRGNSTAR